MTKQEVFDKVCEHLIAQGEASESEGSCLYRGPRGLKCAAGVLIADEHYSPEFEGSPARYAQVADSLVASDVPANALRRVSRLQSLHDNTEPSYWPAGLRDVALEFDLEIPSCIAAHE